MMLKLVGGVAIFASAYLLSSELVRLRERRHLLLKEFCRFISHIKTEISCFLSEPRAFARGFTSEILEESGFLRRLCSGERPGEAFSSSCSEMNLSEAEKELLFDTFSSMCRGYAEDEIRLLDARLSELSRISEAEGVSCRRDVKLIKTLSAALAVAVIILIL